VSWEGLPRLFAQIARRSFGRPPQEDIIIRTEVVGSSLRITADIAAGGRWINHLTARGALSSAGQPAREFELEQVAPGRYWAAVEDLGPGCYLLSLVAEGGGREVASIIELLTVPYPEEYHRIGVDELLLEEIAAETGGEYLEDRLPEEPLLGKPVPKFKRLWPLGVLLGLLAFVADLLLRKIPLGRA
jgi:hypothetical protein